MLFNYHHILCPVHRERNRLAVQYIAIAGFHLNQFILAMRQLIGKHQPSFLIGKERVDYNRRRVINCFCNQFACRQVTDLKPDTGCRNNFPGFCIMLFYTDKAGLCYIVQDIRIGLIICTDIYNEIRNKCLSFLPLCLVYHVTSIRKILRSSKPVCICNQYIAFVLPCRIKASCTGKVNLEFGAFLRFFDNSFMSGRFDIFRRNRNGCKRIRFRLCFRNHLRFIIFCCFFCIL